jgi:hypothetical protein
LVKTVLPISKAIKISKSEKYVTFLKILRVAKEKVTCARSSPCILYKVLRESEGVELRLGHDLVVSRACLCPTDGFFTVTQPLHSGLVFEPEREEGVTLRSWVFSTKLNLLNLPVAILQTTFCSYFFLCSRLQRFFAKQNAVNFLVKRQILISSRGERQKIFRDLKASRNILLSALLITERSLKS